MTHTLEQYRQALAEAGICPDCLQAAQHHYDEPFSTCACGTGEDTAERPMQRLQALEAAITRQANAAKRGMDAAKAAAAHMEAEARRLYAECNPEALESERAANAQLTGDLQRTEAEREALASRVDFLNQQNSAQQEQNDALAALCQEGAAVLERTANDTLDGRNMAVRLREANTTSLARLKAEWQAEAVEHAMRLETHFDRGIYANELRRQAEEASHG